MTHDELRVAFDSEKKSCYHKKTPFVVFDTFAVCFASGGECFLVDIDVANKIHTHKWCLSHGYPASRVNGELIRLHDFVLAYNGCMKPEKYYVDHINQDKRDNRRCNLRYVSPTESSLNMPLKSDNKSGFTGVHRTKDGTFRAYITINHKQLNLGYYKTIEEAVNARREAENRLGFKTRPGTIKQLCEEASNEA